MVTPPSLRHGHKVAVTAPASRVPLRDVLPGLHLLKQWGLEVHTGSTVGNSFHNFSDTLENRLQELQAFLDDPEIRCIFAARGGYGVSDLLDRLDFSAFLRNPKWIIGFSDITALLLHLNALGVAAVHGPMAKTLPFDDSSADALKRTLWGEYVDFSWTFTSKGRSGTAEGQAVGGNLVLLAHCIGSASDVSYDGKILFIEDIGEKLYHIDRLLVQLKRAGKLQRLSGLVVGSFTEMTDAGFGATIQQIVMEHTSAFAFPVALDFAFGHDRVNLPIVMGRQYTLEVTDSRAQLNTVKNGIV